MEGKDKQIVGLENIKMAEVEKYDSKDVVDESNISDNNNNKDEKKISKREEIDILRADNKRYEDLVYELALFEDETRTGLKKDGIVGERLEHWADKISDSKLETIKANKAKWIDEMTGLRNKNAYKEGLIKMLKIEKRMGVDCSILMIDFDHFKKVNDTYGHQIGDKVLKKMADIIKKSLRSSDIVYRYGGEEFVAFLPNTQSVVAAHEVAEKVRTNVESQVLEIMKNDGEKISLEKTISIGVAGTDQLENWDEDDNQDMQEILEKLTKFADEAVYLSKKNGRNKVTLYGVDEEKDKKVSIFSDLFKQFKAVFKKK